MIDNKTVVTYLINFLIELVKKTIIIDKQINLKKKKKIVVFWHMWR